MHRPHKTRQVFPLLITHHSQPRQPQPDTALLNTTPPTAPSIDKVDDTINKVNLATPKHVDADDGDGGDTDRHSRKKRGHRHLREVEAEGLYLWEVTKYYLFQPGVAGGLVGLGTFSCASGP